jgi:hypothetical protein
MSAVSSASVVPFPLPHSPALDRPRPTRRPHEPATIAAVRLLFERTTLTYAEIASRTGVSQASISRYGHAGGWRRPPGAPKVNAFANGLPSPQVRGRLLARRLRDIAQRYLDEMEKDPDPTGFHDCGTVLEMLRMAKEEERRKPRRPLIARARAIAERYLDQMEKDPEVEPEMLAWVLKMLEIAREEEAIRPKRSDPKPKKEVRIPYPRRKEMEPSPHPPEAIERARIAVAESRAAARRASAERAAATRRKRREMFG